jgi:hypothetical protein
LNCATKKERIPMYTKEQIQLAIKITESMDVELAKNCDLPLPLKYAALISINFGNKVVSSEEGLDTLVDEFISENYKMMSEMFPYLEIEAWKKEVKTTLLDIINE